MGCGDGRALRALAEYVIRATERGKHLDEYPLFLIGRDYNESRAPAPETRSRFSSRSTASALRWSRRTSRTGCVQRNRARAGFRIRNEREKRDPSLELRDLAHTFMFLVHNRRLSVRMSRCAPYPRDRITSSGERRSAPRSPRRAAEEWTCDQRPGVSRICNRPVRTSFVDDTGLCRGSCRRRPRCIFSDAAAHSRQGFIAVEAHSPSSTICSSSPGLKAKRDARRKASAHPQLGMHASLDSTCSLTMSTGSPSLFGGRAAIDGAVYDRSRGGYPASICSTAIASSVSLRTVGRHDAIT